jgi:hypothetical protein
VKPTRWNQRDGKWLEPMGRAQRTLVNGLERAARRREARAEVRRAIDDNERWHR